MVCQNKIAKKALKKQPSHHTTPLSSILNPILSLILWHIMEQKIFRL